MSCDFIMPTAFPDHYSLQALDTFLKNVLPEWHMWQRQIVKVEADNLFDSIKKFMFPRNPPKILPILILGYKAKMVDQAAGNWVSAITNYIEMQITEWSSQLFADTQQIIGAGTVELVPPAHQKTFYSLKLQNDSY
ncbi:hypothetical protein HK100_005017 [Physocladia obscura]|uniref:Uncharacterized protein n=1 Tax=Physocladia obscura TaxID=109957 RepID=A0AAD5SUF2_9FUNG|nr:hypothetical protein HK100_005017 [Physocladia obscura]